MVKDITHFLSRFEYAPEATTREWLGSDYWYHTLITNVHDAERFNYQSDYWGSADEYQEDNVNLMLELEPYVGMRCKVDCGGGDCVEGTLDGILIDNKYNSIAHTCVLFSDYAEKEA